jgi:hypothetical protein
MLAACKNGISPSILTNGWHGGSDVLIGSYSSAYWWHGGRVQELYNSINFGVLDDMDVLMFWLVSPFWRMGGTAVACKNGILAIILA